MPKLLFRTKGEAKNQQIPGGRALSTQVCPTKLLVTHIWLLQLWASHVRVSSDKDQRPTPLAVWIELCSEVTTYSKFEQKLSPNTGCSMFLLMPEKLVKRQKWDFPNVFHLPEGFMKISLYIFKDKKHREVAMCVATFKHNMQSHLIWIIFGLFLFLQLWAINGRANASV